LSADGLEAVVFVSVLPADAAALSMHGLAHAAPHIHAEVAKLVRMRRVPGLRFELDEGIKKEAAVLAAIKEGTQREEALRLQRQAREVEGS
jgi:ribosome-binding factor A